MSIRSTIASCSHALSAATGGAGTLILCAIAGAGYGALPGAETGPVPRAAATFVGPLAGGPADARVAVVVEGDRFVAYACSGDGDCVPSPTRIRRLLSLLRR